MKVDSEDPDDDLDDLDDEDDFEEEKPKRSAKVRAWLGAAEHSR